MIDSVFAKPRSEAFPSPCTTDSEGLKPESVTVCGGHCSTGLSSQGSLLHESCQGSIYRGELVPTDAGILARPSDSLCQGARGMI